MKYTLTALCLLAIVALPVHPRCMASPYPHQSHTGEEYAVYSALLNKRFAKAPGKELLIVSRTCEAEFAVLMLGRGDARQRLSPASPPLLEGFKARHMETRALGRQLILEVDYRFIDEAEWRGLYAGDPVKSWEEFERRHPDSSGVVCLSEIVFNEGMTEALAYVDYGCGSTCGEGWFVVLRKQGEVWRVEKEERMRIL